MRTGFRPGFLDPDLEWKEIQREERAAERHANSVQSPQDFGLGLSEEEIKLIEPTIPQQWESGWFNK